VISFEPEASYTKDHYTSTYLYSIIPVMLFWNCSRKEHSASHSRKIRIAILFLPTHLPILFRRSELFQYNTKGFHILPLGLMHIKNLGLSAHSLAIERKQEKSRVLVKLWKGFLMVFISPSNAIYASRSRTWSFSIVTKISPSPVCSLWV
jgi:hypothetical protein